MEKHVRTGLALIVCIAGCADGEPPVSGPPIPITGDNVPDIAPPRPTDRTAEDNELPPPPVPSEKGPWPRVSVEETTHKFGRMQVGTKLKHQFEIRNDGDAPMKLQAGKSTCKCTVFKLDKEVIAPGEIANLMIEWEGKFRDPNFQHGGPVFTDDPKRTEINFVVTGEVDAPFEILPEGTWDVADLTESEAGTASGIIATRLFNDFEITDIVTESEFISTEIVALTESQLTEVAAKCGYKITVTLSPDCPPGKFFETLEFKVNRGNNVAMKIGVSATREGPIKVVTTNAGIWVGSQTSLRMGQFDKEDGHKSTMVLVTRSADLEGELKILEAETNPRFLKVELEPFPGNSETASRYKLHVEVPAGIPPTRRGSTNPAFVKLRTNHPKGENFDFEVSFNAF